MIGSLISFAVGAFIIWGAMGVYRRPTWDFWLLIMMGFVFLVLGLDLTIEGMRS